MSHGGVCAAAALMEWVVVVRGDCSGHLCD